MPSYQDKMYVRLFSPLMKILSSFRQLTTGSNEPAAYVAYSDVLTEERYSEYISFVDACMAEIDSVEKDALDNIKNGELVPMFYLFEAFKLNSFEKFCFLLSFACASEACFRRMINYIYDDYSIEYPSVELCAHILCPNAEGSLSLCSSFVDGLDMQRFLYAEKGNNNAVNITKLPLMISDRVYRFLYDITGEDELLKGIVSSFLAFDDRPDMVINRKYTDKIKNLFGITSAPHCICIRGCKGVGKKTILYDFCNNNSLNILMVDIERLEQESRDGSLEAIVDRIVRESILRGKALIAFTDYSSERIEEKFLQRLVWQLEKKVTFFFLTVEENINIETSFRQIEVMVDEPGYDEMCLLWDYYIKKSEMMSVEDASKMSVRLSEQYTMTPEAISAAVVYATMAAKSNNQSAISYDGLVEGCRRQFSHAISKDAVKINTVYGMDNLILPDIQKNRLKEACNQIRYKNLVYNTWGFADKMAYGRGVSMIFYGPPGTGKTMGAQVMAKELGLELYRVDLSSIMSKYVGESEKKLNNIFDQGKKSQCILFFDEADSLFGKRSEVKDSQDKYANASTAFLLQKMEDYDGIIILATNFLQNFDTAFMRRFKYLIEFPFPDEKERIEIWKNVFPDKAPIDAEVDFEYLGRQFKLSGSQIKSTVLASLFLAAGEGCAVGMQHILVSIKREMKKQGKNLLEADFGQYFYLVEGME